jgi:hypothetical protein
MPSFTTIYRAVVMCAVGAIIVKGWQSYGPSAAQVKSAAIKAIDWAKTTSSEPQEAAGDASQADPRGPAPRFDNSSHAADAQAAAPGVIAGQEIAPNTAGSHDLNAAPLLEPLATTPIGTGAAPSDTDADPMAALMSRLEELGVIEPKLAPWGATGRLFRFCCRAPLADAPNAARHFESVAAEPTAAVQQVVAKVEAWRLAQRSGSEMR